MSKLSLTRTVAASMVGNLFEFYDFALFGYFAPIIGKLFFPSNNPTAELLSAFGVFAAGFIVRPLGGALFGYIGDRFGRKRALILALLLMAIPTALIGALPTYETMGITASVLLIIFRMLQGLSMGGNYSGSITFVTEHTPASKRGFMGGLAVTSCLVGILLGSATAALFSNIMAPHELHTFGWRIPFLLGIFICFVGMYMRRKVKESPEFLKNQAREDKPDNETHPLAHVLRHHKKQLACAVGATILHDLSFYLLFVYMTTYLTTVLGVVESTALAINTINLCVVSIVTVISSWLSDRIGRKRILCGAAIFFIVGTIPLMQLMNTQHTLMILAGQFCMALGVGMYFGPIPALMVEAFPTSVRFSASALTTNISGPLFGGATPMLMTALIGWSGSAMIPAFYLTIVACIALYAVTRIQNVMTKGT